MIIRAIEEKDIPACLAIYNYYVLHTDVTFDTEACSLSGFRKKVETVIRSYPWIVGEEDGKIIGYACLSAYNPKAAYRFSADVTVYLEKDERGKGYGKQLMKRLEEIASEDHYQTLVSLVTESNLPSIRLHESLGYRRFARFENAGYKNGTWLSTVFFEKRLGSCTGQPEEIRNIPAGEVSF